jgi:hypothetical protein
MLDSRPNDNSVSVAPWFNVIARTGADVTVTLVPQLLTVTGNTDADVLPAVGATDLGGGLLAGPTQLVKVRPTAAHTATANTGFIRPR